MVPSCGTRVSTAHLDDASLRICLAKQPYQKLLRQMSSHRFISLYDCLINRTMINRCSIISRKCHISASFPHRRTKKRAISNVQCKHLSPFGPVYPISRIHRWATFLCLMETSLKGDYEEQSDQRMASNRARNIDWSVARVSARRRCTCWWLQSCRSIHMYMYIYDGPWRRRQRT